MNKTITHVKEHLHLAFIYSIFHQAKVACRIIVKFDKETHKTLKIFSHQSEHLLLHGQNGLIAHSKRLILSKSPTDHPLMIMMKVYNFRPIMALSLSFKLRGFSILKIFLVEEPHQQKPLYSCANLQVTICKTKSQSCHYLLL